MCFNNCNYWLRGAERCTKPTNRICLDSLTDEEIAELKENEPEQDADEQRDLNRYDS